MTLRASLRDNIKQAVKPVTTTTRTDYFAANPIASAIATKLVPDRRFRQPSAVNQEDSTLTLNDETIFNDMMTERAKKNLDADTIIQLNPDIRLIRETLVSCIRSPLSMDDDELTYNVGDSDLPMSLTSAMLDPIESYFNGPHRLSDDLSDMIADALVNRGASIWAIIPEASLDDLINKSASISTESAELYQETVMSHFFNKESGILKSVGILGNPTATDKTPRTSLESFWNDELMTDQKVCNNLFITDNSAQLRLSYISAAFNKANTVVRSNSRAGLRRLPRAVSTESLVATTREVDDKRSMRMEVESIQRSLYNPRTRRSGKRNPAQIIKSAHEASRSSIGHPIVIPLNNESTIPIFVPGNEKNHIGYFVITDGFGQPLNVTQELKRFQQQGMGGFNGTNTLDSSSAILQQVSILQNGYSINNEQSMAERMRLFGDLLENNVVSRIKNGLRGQSVKMKYTEDMMRLLFMRLLSNEMTHMIFISTDQVAYLAYEYDENGMGVSMLDGVKQIATLRTMVNFANFMAAVRNAVGRTKVTINIDERDPDPEKSAAILQDEFLRNQAGITPTDVSSSSEMFRTLRQMGITFEIQGNTRIPNTTVGVEESHGQRPPIDTEFSESLEKQLYMGFYLTKEMVDATQGSDFAITRWTSNQLFGKRIRNIQKITEVFCKKYTSVYVLSDGELISQLQEIIEANKDALPANYLEQKDKGSVKYSEVIEEFLEALEVRLPSPDNTKLDVQMDQLNKYVQGLDVALQAWVANDFAEFAMGDEDRDNLGPLIASLKAYYIRDYMIKNNIFPELAELTRQGTEDIPAINFSKELILHVTNLANNLGDWSAFRKAAREKMVEMRREVNPEAADIIDADRGNGGGTTDTTTDTTSNDGGDDTQGGDDPFSMPDFNEGEDFGETTPPDDNPGSEPAEPEEPASDTTPPADNAGDQPNQPAEPTNPMM